MTPTDKDVSAAARWEAFCDASYYDLWCVRPVGSRTFGDGFHLVSGNEAHALADMLNSAASSHSPSSEVT